MNIGQFKKEVKLNSISISMGWVILCQDTFLPDLLPKIIKIYIEYSQFNVEIPGGIEGVGVVGSGLFLRESNQPNSWAEVGYAVV